LQGTKPYIYNRSADLINVHARPNLNILFITSNRLGDAVLSTGILGALIDRYRHARITVACGPLPAPLFRAAPQVERVIALVKQPRHGHWRMLWLDTIGARWDLIVDLRNTLVSRLLWSRTRKSFVGPKPRQHMVEALAGLIGVDPRDAAPRVWLDSEARAEVAVALPRPAKLLVLAPCVHGIGKRWPPERYAALACRLVGAGGVMAGGMVAVLGSNIEREQAAPVIAALPAAQVIDLVGKTLPNQAAAWLARADLYVGNDSGLTHLAAAVGAPTLALFGPGIPSRYRPWGRHAQYLIANEDPERTVDMCKIDDMLAFAEMKKLLVARVAAAAEALYRLESLPSMDAARIARICEE
jgi:heptosyltransferase-3